MPVIDFRATICSLCGTDAYVRLCRSCGRAYCYECTQQLPNGTCRHIKFQPIKHWSWDTSKEYPEGEYNG